MTINIRARQIAQAIHEWLDDESGRLKEAIGKTTAEGLFPHHDISFALHHIRESVNEKTLTEWLESFHTENREINSKRNILVLHAGNLPLVGFQDVVAVLLSGHRYFGKLSRKDPYLLDSFLEYLGKHGITDNFCWSTDLSEFESFTADLVMFSGSEDSARQVIDLLEAEHRTDTQTRFLIRTAHASAVWFDMQFGGWDDLIEAIFRYEGRGCRSVAAIFTPNEESEIINKLTEVAADFLTKNQPSGNPKPQLAFQDAYNQAIGRLSVISGTILVQESEAYIRKDALVTVQKATQSEADLFMKSSGKILQSMYTNIPEHPTFEPLELAQKPPINWKPDGVDPLEFLLGE